MAPFLWALPALIVVVAIASGRLDTTRAALLGLIAAMPVAVSTGPVDLGGSGLALALGRGLWIGATIAPYILGGLLFWQVAMDDGAGRPGALASPIARVGSADGVGSADRDGSAGGDGSTVVGRSAGAAIPGDAARSRRRLLFFACFLIGPFAEAATGFGVGMLGTIALIRGLGLAPRFLMVFALMSQTLIPWGGMGSGTMLAAAYARMAPAELGLYCVVPVSLLMAVWLPLFWRCAARAGLGAPASECLREAGWLVAGLGLIALSTAWLGPETALLAAYAPLIVARYLFDQRPDRKAVAATARRILPYAALIALLVVTRLQPTLKAGLAGFGRLAPFDDLPAWSPLFHAGSWLIVGGLVTALMRGRIDRLGEEARSAWRTGRQAVLTVFLFAMMAEVLAAGGISRAAADALFAAWQSGAILVTPFIAGAFGILANSGNAPNSLMMPSQLAVAQQAGLAVAAVAALQHVSATSMSLFSPVRMSIAAQLAGGRGEERGAYALMLPFAVAGFVVLLAVAVAVVAGLGQPLVR